MDLISGMQPALEAARACLKIGPDVPVGCAIYQGDKLLTVTCNTREKDGNVAGHAELSALTEACRLLKDWRLSGCTLFVTLEPCPMCAGAIAAARISRLVYGAPRTDRSVPCQLLLPPDMPVFPGICAEESAALLQSFFAGRRLP